MKISCSVRVRGIEEIAEGKAGRKRGKNENETI
jgi:hypothetical protein